jgi:DNA-binding transcriptional MerR regulator
VEKGPDAFRTISEVADDLDLPQHVLRFWETRFTQIKPMKRGGGRRYYRPDDVDLLRGIRHLLYGEGYTIRGVQQILKDQGLRYVQTVGRSAETDSARLRDVDYNGEAAEEQTASASVSAGSRGGVVSFVPPVRARPEPEMPRQEMPRTLEPRIVEVSPRPPVPQQPQSYEEDGPAIPFRRFAPVPDREETPRMPPRPQVEEPVYEPRAVVPEERYEPRVVQEEQPLPEERYEPRVSYEPRVHAEPPVHQEPRIQREVRYEPRAAAPQPRMAPARAPMPEPPGSMRLSSEAVRLLKATLYELGECRRLLDASIRKSST